MSKLGNVLLSALLCFALVPAGAVAATASSPEVAHAESAASKAKTYKVKYVLNGGKNVKANKTKYSGKLTFKSPKRSGYTFKGWYSDKKCTKRVKSVTNKNITVYAKWAKKKSSSSSSASEPKGDVVYLSQTGTKYHRSSCRTLKKTPIKTTRSSARSRGYEACKVCRP